MARDKQITSHPNPIHRKVESNNKKRGVHAKVQNCVKLSANFWKSFFLRPRLKCRSFCGTGKADWEPVWFFENFPKVWPQSSVLRWEAFEELIRSPKKSTVDTKPAVSAPVFGVPYQPCFQQPNFSVSWLLAAVGMKFLEKKGPRISPLWY